MSVAIEDEFAVPEHSIACTQIVDNLKDAEAVLVVDVSNLAYRCMYAYSELSTKDGKPSGHVYGLFKILRATLLNDLPAKKWCIAFCYDEPTSKAPRQAIVPTYKANREKRDFSPLPDAKDALQYVPGLHISHPDREADDAIYWVATNAWKMGKEVTVLSGDKDLWTLFGFGINVFSPNLGRLVNQGDILKSFFVADARKIPMVKSVFGDTSDNIKGPERLLKKHVVPYLAQNDTVWEFLRSVEVSTLMPKKTKDKILMNTDVIVDNYKVVKANTEGFSVSEHIKKTASDSQNKKMLELLFRRYEFNSLFDSSGVYFGDSIPVTSSIEEAYGL